MKKIGIIGAMQVEIEGLVSQLKNKKQKRIGGLLFYKGTISSKNSDTSVVVVRCGIGKVYSSAAAAIMINSFKELELIINLGVAGGVDKNLRQGDFVVGDFSVLHDFDLTVEGLKIGQLTTTQERGFKSCPIAVNKMQKALEKSNARVKVGTIVSGDQFINSKQKVTEFRQEFNALACDMETAAIAQTCDIFNVPFLGIRAISDNADDTAGEDFNSFVKKAAQKSIAAVMQFVMS